MANFISRLIGDRAGGERKQFIPPGVQARFDREDEEYRRSQLTDAERWVEDQQAIVAEQLAKLERKMEGGRSSRAGVFAWVFAGGLAGSAAVASQVIEYVDIDIQFGTGEPTYNLYGDTTARMTPDHERPSMELEIRRTAIELGGDPDVDVVCASTSFANTGDGDPQGVHLREHQTESGETLIVLQPDKCFQLTHPEIHSPLQVANSVFITAHEIGHNSGVDDEGITNCLAVATYPKVAKSLGVDEYIEGIDPMSIALRLPARYHTHGC